MEENESHRSKERGMNDSEDISERKCASALHCWMEKERNGMKEGRVVKEKESPPVAVLESGVTTRRKESKSRNKE